MRCCVVSSSRRLRRFVSQKFGAIFEFHSRARLKSTNEGFADMSCRSNKKQEKKIQKNEELERERAKKTRNAKKNETMIALSKYHTKVFTLSTRSSS
jgi:competence protein ComGF